MYTSLCWVSPLYLDQRVGCMQFFMSGVNMYKHGFMLWSALYVRSNTYVYRLRYVGVSPLYWGQQILSFLYVEVSPLYWGQQILFFYVEVSPLCWGQHLHVYISLCRGQPSVLGSAPTCIHFFMSGSALSVGVNTYMYTFLYLGVSPVCWGKPSVLGSAPTCIHFFI